MNTYDSYCKYIHKLHTLTKDAFQGKYYAQNALKEQHFMSSQSHHCAVHSIKPITLSIFH